MTEKRLVVTDRRADRDAENRNRPTIVKQIPSGSGGFFAKPMIENPRNTPPIISVLRIFCFSEGFEQAKSRSMKFALLALALLSLNSCNTIIGMYRDTKQAVIWTKDKIQGSGGGGGDAYSDAPVY
jgi:predicted small secreted protein